MVGKWAKGMLVAHAGMLVHVAQNSTYKITKQAQVTSQRNTKQDRVSRLVWGVRIGCCECTYRIKPIFALSDLFLLRFFCFFDSFQLPHLYYQYTLLLCVVCCVWVLQTLPPLSCVSCALLAKKKVATR